MRVLVTGGNGFIGGFTVEELERRGHEPFIFDRRLKRREFDLYLGDIRDSEAVTEAMAHAEAWIHLAGVLGTQETIANPLPAAGTNILGGLNVLQAASQYDLPGVNIAVGNWWMDNTYSISKSTIERFVAMYEKERGLRVSSVRAFNAYGPRQSVYGESKVRKIMPSFVCRAIDGQPIQVYGDGSQIMDMIHATDVARVLVDTLEQTIEAPQGTVEAGTARRTTVAEIAELVADTVTSKTGCHVPVEFLPMRPGEPAQSVVVADAPNPEDPILLEDGVRETVDWYLARYS